VLYVCQIFPHEHCETGHADNRSAHHNAPVAHAHHSHSDKSDTEHGTDSPETEHHHDLAQHVDSFFLHPTSQKVVSLSDCDVAVVSLPGDPCDQTVPAGWRDAGDGGPESGQTSSPESRAPPARV
jgi:hypothetical protein